MATIAEHNYEAKERVLKELNSMVQGCMDSYSSIPDQVIEEQLELPAHYGEIASILLNIFAGLIYLKYLIILILIICIKVKGKKD